MHCRGIGYLCYWSVGCVAIQSDVQRSWRSFQRDHMSCTPGDGATDLPVRRSAHPFRGSLLSKHVCGIDAQGASYRASDGKRAGDSQRQRNRSEHKWILRCGLVDDRRQYSAGGDPEQHTDHAPAGQQYHHAAECGRKNLFRLRTQRDANAQLAQPLAHSVGGEAEVPVIDSSNPKAPNKPSAAVATCDTKNVSPNWFFQGLDSRTGMAGSRSRITFRTVAPISITAASEESGRIRTTNEVCPVASCVMGKNATGSGFSVREKYFPSATTPTICTAWPSLFLKARPTASSV